MLSSTIVAHDFLDLLADAALVNVHVARLARSELPLAQELLLELLKQLQHQH